MRHVYRQRSQTTAGSWVAEIRVLWAHLREKPQEQPLIYTADQCHQGSCRLRAAQCVIINKFILSLPPITWQKMPGYLAHTLNFRSGIKTELGLNNLEGVGKMKNKLDNSTKSPEQTRREALSSNGPTMGLSLRTHTQTASPVCRRQALQHAETGVLSSMDVSFPTDFPRATCSCCHLPSPKYNQQALELICNKNQLGRSARLHWSYQDPHCCMLLGWPQTGRLCLPLTSLDLY